MFLAFAGLYWLYSFAQAPRRTLQRVWIVATALAGLAFIASIAQAYSVQTIVTWNSALVPVALCLNALVGGPVLAGLGLRASGCIRPRGRGSLALAGTSLAALGANVAVYVLQARHLDGMANQVVGVGDLVPHYGAMVAVFAVLCACGIALFACAGGTRPTASAGTGARRAVFRSAAGCLLVFAGIFTMRFAFYMTHMTVGLGF